MKQSILPDLFINIHNGAKIDRNRPGIS